MEEDIVKFIREIAGDDENILCGIGDDAALLRAKENILATSDQFIEDVHFRCEYATYKQIGKKALNVNVSDIAAMGGHPKWALVCLGLPRSLTLDEIKDIVRGIVGAAAIWGVKIVGGDLSSADKITISITILGEAPKTPLLRSGAKIGDHIWVTGFLGDSAAGLEALKKQIDAPYLIERHLNPTPRLEAGQALVGMAHSLMDLSDGLGSDLNRLCRESKVGARVYTNQLPISEPLQNTAPALGQDVYDFALYGGEDYELLFTTPAETPEDILSALSIPVTAIGKIVSQDNGIRLIGPDGKSEVLKWAFDHFTT